MSLLVGGARWKGQCVGERFHFCPEFLNGNQLLFQFYFKEKCKTNTGRHGGQLKNSRYLPYSVCSTILVQGGVEAVTVTNSYT